MQSEGTPISARHSQMLLSFDDYAGPAEQALCLTIFQRLQRRRLWKRLLPLRADEFRGELLPRTPVGECEQADLFENAAPPVRSNAC